MTVDIAVEMVVVVVVEIVVMVKVVGSQTRIDGYPSR